MNYPLMIAPAFGFDKGVIVAMSDEDLLVGIAIGLEKSTTGEVLIHKMKSAPPEVAHGQNKSS
jgi:hypothetical protein